MNTDAGNSTVSTGQDIDLFLLLEKSILFFKKYRTVFIAAIIGGIGLGIFGYYTLPKTYSSRLIAHSSVLTNQEHIQIIDNWNDLIHKKEYAEVAKAFNCSETILHKLKKIEGTEIQKVFTANNPNGFYIDITITNNSVLDELQKGIVYGLNNGDYVKERLNFKKERMKELIDEMKVEIIKLDSTKKEIENIISGKGRSPASLIIDGSNITRQSIDLKEKLLYLQEDQNFVHGIEVLQGFQKFDKPVGRTLIVSIILGLILCLPIAYIYALFSSIKHGLKVRRLAHQKS